MADYTWADGEVANATKLNAIQQQLNIICTSATRPTGATGMQIYETDTGRVMRYISAAWVIMSEPRQSWSPTITQSSAVSGTVNRGWYRRSYGLWEARLKWTASASGTAANPITFSLPVTLADTNDLGGTWNYSDAGTYLSGPVLPSTTTAAAMIQNNSSAAFGGSVTIASGDILYLTLFGSY